MKNDMATTKSVFAKLNGGASLAAFAKLNLNIVSIDIKKQKIENKSYNFYLLDLFF